MLEIAIIIALVLGFGLGILFCKLRANRPMGVILMHSADDPDVGPSMFVELYCQPETLYDHKQVIFDISHK